MMTVSWRRLRTLVQKEFWQLWRDKSNLLLAIVLPVMLILAVLSALARVAMASL